MLLSDFPREIIEQIADRLSLEDKRSCYLACKAWKGVFQYSLYSDLVINRHLLNDLVNSSQDNQPPCLKTRLLVRYLELNEYTVATDEELYLLQQTFPNLKYLYFHQNSISPDNFGVTTDWNIWKSLSDIRIEFDQRRVPDVKNKLVKMLLCLPLLRRMEIFNEYRHKAPASFSLDDFETIHSHLKHVGHLKLSLDLLNLSDAEIERMTKVSAATNIRSLNIISENTDHRWLCYFARKYPNLHTIELCTNNIIFESDEERSDTIKLFQQVPLPFQRLTKLNFENRNCTGKAHILFWDIINFHNMPLKHLSVVIDKPYGTINSNNTRDISKHVTEVCLEGFSNTIESFRLTFPNEHSTPVDFAEIKSSLYNLVELSIGPSTSVEIDTLLSAAPRLRKIELGKSDIKLKDELYNSNRFGLQSFIVEGSKITSDVLQFLSFHCRSLNELMLRGSSVYGNFTKPGCQFIDMTHTRLEKFNLEDTSFLIQDNEKCPENLNITLITWPTNDVPLNQDHDPNVLPAVADRSSFKVDYNWLYTNNDDEMLYVSPEPGSNVLNSASNYEENKRITFKRAHDTKRRKLYVGWNNSCVFRYTKIKICYLVDLHIDYSGDSNKN